MAPPPLKTATPQRYIKMAVHSKIGASSMYRWANCPGSVRESDGINSPESPYAAEGTVAHEVAATMLENYYRIGKNKRIKASPEMLEAVQVYYDTIREDVLKDGCESVTNHVLIEHKFDLSKIHAGLFGTGDCVVYHMKKKLLRSYDYKHGAGIAVEVRDNQQLMYYALGALMTCGFACEKVEIIVVQPRCHHPDGPVRRQMFDAIDLMDFASDLKDAALRTEESKAPLKTGKWCRFCPAAAAKCSLIHKQALAAAKIEFKPQVKYDTLKLSKTLDQLAVLESWCKSVREFAYNEAKNGVAIPGFKLVEKRAIRRWRLDEGETTKKLHELFGGKEIYFDEPKLLSPAKIEKILPKNNKPKLEELVLRQSSGLALVPMDDKRMAAKVAASDEFEAIKGT